MKAEKTKAKTSSGDVRSKPTIAIIVRRNRDVERVLEVLEREGIAAQAERGADIFAHPVGTIFFDLIEYLANPGNIEALAKTVAGGLWNLNFARKTALIKAIRAGNLAEISVEISAIGALQKELTKDGAVQFLIQAAELSGFTKIAAREPLLAEVWRSIVVLAQDLAEEKRIQSPVALIEELLAYRLSAETKSIKISVGRPDAQVKVMTAHSSKGLEFDHVILPYATEEAWMSGAHKNFFVLPREKDDKDEERDARRLFYVALTRAKKHATIITDLEDGTQKSFSPLRFIAELDKKSVKETTLPAVFENSVAKMGRDVNTKERTEIMDYAKNILTEKGLSVTALNHFMECPSKFFYKSILKLPEAPNASSEKGNAMHEALAEVWRQKEHSDILKNVGMFSEVIEKVIRQYFARSLLPLFEKEPAVEELLEAAPKVAVALMPMFNLPGKALAESWVEAPFEGKYGGEAVTIPLHGKLDVIVDGEDKTQVFDYKTREAMSVNALKGETKDSDGNYFRQLIFYKILLEGNARYKNKKIEPALVFIKPDSKGRCPTITLPIEKADEKRVLEEIQKLVESVWSGDFLTDSCEDKKCEWCGMKRETLFS